MSQNDTQLARKPARKKKAVNSGSREKAVQAHMERRRAARGRTTSCSRS